MIPVPQELRYKNESVTTNISLPTYKQKNSYELYKQVLLAWSEVIDLAEKRQGVVIDQSLPEDDE